MREVKTKPRFRCDFCKRTGTKWTITLHEQRCFKNPNRFCDACGNTGKIMGRDSCQKPVEHEFGLNCDCPMTLIEDCPYCERYRDYLRRQEDLGTDSSY
ncbi:MAG TPA: hypothetical protein VN519_06485 [Bryobacteraceae bacterium]|nr:hypothetical protein [Bryobacteraceae bacterium]